MSSVLISNENLTLDDFLQLQSLLNHEQEDCDKHIEACHDFSKTHVHPVHHARPLKFRRAINAQAAHESKLERQRLEQALLTIKYLKDQYRRQRAAQIQAYLEEYRRQALIRAVLQEEEERYYRQCIAAAIEQRRVNYLWEQFMEAKKQQMLQEKLEEQVLYQQRGGMPQAVEQREEREEEEEDEEDYTSSEDDEGYSDYHSEQLANLLKQIFASQVPNEEAESVAENVNRNTTAATAATAAVDNDETSMAEVWKYLNAQRADSETPRAAFLSPEQNKVLNENAAAVRDDQDNADNNSTVSSSGHSSPTPEANQQREIKALPPLQNHVVTLQDLIQQLAAEPVLVGEQYAQPPSNKAGEALEEKKEKEKEKVSPIKIEEKKPFLPQHIFTEAEPTPTEESIPEREQEEDEGEAHFVDAVAAEQKNQQVPPDPRKAKAEEELDHISDQLANSDLVKRWEQVLQSELSFSKQPEGTLLLTASTDANRQFLGSEDEIMRVLLKLDSIDALGDDSIRQKRRSLVKKCEHMLEQLDQLKKSQWEKVVSSNQQSKHRRRRNKKSRKHRH